MLCVECLLKRALSMRTHVFIVPDNMPETQARENNMNWRE